MPRLRMYAPESEIPKIQASLELTSETIVLATNKQINIAANTMNSLVR